MGSEINFLKAQEKKLVMPQNAWVYLHERDDCFEEVNMEDYINRVDSNFKVSHVKAIFTNQDFVPPLYFTYQEI